MAMTAAVKDELSRLTVVKPCCRKAETATLLRLAGSIHLVQGRIVIEAELDAAAAARRLRKSISEIYGHVSELGVIAQPNSALRLKAVASSAGNACGRADWLFAMPPHCAAYC